MENKETKPDDIAAFCVELPRKLLQQFDRWVKDNLFSNRSEAVRYLMRQAINQGDQQPHPDHRGGNSKQS